MYVYRREYSEEPFRRPNLFLATHTHIPTKSRQTLTGPDSRQHSSVLVFVLSLRATSKGTTRMRRKNSLARTLTLFSFWPTAVEAAAVVVLVVAVAVAASGALAV
ncbi:unnamed protein product [Ceratitis capitata]|uniref:(Mediterranean fruit fly) hypothetical protein n=1 Tax=Ceratitis capitata TaxID=7213 RepID=A0A811U1A3_CERCA|nr:unnamed protein product [Ceratitis capitata]